MPSSARPCARQNPTYVPLRLRERGSTKNCPCQDEAAKDEEKEATDVVLKFMVNRHQWVRETQFRRDVDVDKEVLPVLESRQLTIDDMKHFALAIGAYPYLLTMRKGEDDLR